MVNWISMYVTWLPAAAAQLSRFCFRLISHSRVLLFFAVFHSLPFHLQALQQGHV
jgi:hypothetical protein